MPNKKKTRILAIDPGTKEMGIAVLDDSTLLYHGVETTKKFPSPHERLRQWRKIVERLLSDFRPTMLTVEKTFFANNRNAALLNVLADEIRSLGRRRGIPVVSLAPNTVKKAVAGNGWASKEQVAIAIAAKYPELKTYLPPDRMWKQRHHHNMFDAVALGVACLASRTKNGSRPPSG